MVLTLLGCRLHRHTDQFTVNRVFAAEIYRPVAMPLLQGALPSAVPLQTYKVVLPY